MWIKTNISYFHHNYCLQNENEILQNEIQTFAEEKRTVGFSKIQMFIESKPETEEGKKQNEVQSERRRRWDTWKQRYRDWANESVTPSH